MLTLTENAQKAVSRFISGAEEPVTGLRIGIAGGGCSGFQYTMALEKNPEDDDTVLDIADFKVYVDPHSAPLLAGVSVDFLDGLEGSGFKFENPNATNSCACGSSFSCG